MLRRLLAATALLLLAATAPAGAAEPILPLGQVAPGMRCTGLTVVRGVDIGSFDVEVIDVVAGDPVADQPLILVRVSGGVAEQTGIAEGYSGSPVVCDGRIAGAIAYGTGDYGNKLGLATPIEALLGQPVPTPAAARRDPALLRRARPLATPLSVTGVEPSVLAPFARAAATGGLRLAAVPAAPSGPSFPVQELRPGASMAVGLASGDLSVGAVGTVSYVDGAKVWGFGHPFEAVGPRSLLLEDAWVYTVIDNPIGLGSATSAKFAAPGHDVGTLTYDGRNGVGGVIGALPPRTALRIVARDDATGVSRTSTAQVAAETDVGLPSGASPATLVAPMALAQAAYTALDGSPAQQSATMCVRIAIRELPTPAGFCQRYVGAFGTSSLDATGGVQASTAPFVTDLANALGAVDAFVFGTPHVTSVDVDLHVRPGLDQAFLRSVSGPATLRRGSTATLRVGLQRYRGAAFTRTVRLRVPRSLPRGRLVLALAGTAADSGTSSSELEIVVGGGEPAGGDSGPRSFPALAARIASLGKPDTVTAGFTRPGSRRALGRRPLWRDGALRISGSAGYPVRIR
jgi:hypothetical protein